MNFKLPAFFIPGHAKEAESLIPVMGILVLLVGVSSIQTGMLMGGMLLFSLAAGSVIISLSSYMVPARIRHVIVVVISATLVTIAYLAMQVFFYEITLSAGIFLPLVAMNCLLAGWLQEYGFDRSITTTCMQAVLAGLVVMVICILFGMIRDVVELPVIQQNSMVFFFTAFLLALNNFLISRWKYNDLSRGRP